MQVKLPPAFQFSQSSLQDFVDCPRRFQLRYIQEQDWPAPVAEPMSDVERADAIGRRFHLLLERYWLGLPVGDIGITDPILSLWWTAFLANLPALPGTIRRPEVHTSARVHDQRMVATFDLLAYEPGGQAVIVDWKTSHRRPTRVWLDRRLQTIIYPLLLVESSKRLLGYQLRPEDVQMIYWFAIAPTDPEVFQYSTERYEADQQHLAVLLDELLSMDTSIWPLTPNIKLCRLCQYRSLCDRGVKAGDLEDIYDEETPDLEDVVISTPEPDDFVL